MYVNIKRYKKRLARWYSSSVPHCAIAATATALPRPGEARVVCLGAETPGGRSGLTSKSKSSGISSSSSSG